MLGAATDDITWWENTTGDGTRWIEHTVERSLHRAPARSTRRMWTGTGTWTCWVAAANEYPRSPGGRTRTGDGTAGSEHPMDWSYNLGYSVFAADVDGDGDVDVLGAGHSS